MIPLIITPVRHAVSGQCKGGAAALEHLSCDDQWLIGDGRLSIRCQSCEKLDQCPVQDKAIIVNWFGAVLWGAVRVVHLVSINRCGRSLDGESS